MVITGVLYTFIFKNVYQNDKSIYHHNLHIINQKIRLIQFLWIKNIKKSQFINIQLLFCYGSVINLLMIIINPTIMIMCFISRLDTLTSWF